MTRGLIREDCVDTDTRKRKTAVWWWRLHKPETPRAAGNPQKLEEVRRGPRSSLWGAQPC